MVWPRTDEHALLSAADLCRAAESALRLLRVDAIDVYHMHAVTPELYDHVVNELVPEMLVEVFALDPGAPGVPRALKDDCCDV